MERFIQKWNSEQYGPSEKQSIYEISNQMLRKRLRTFPDFYNYINALDLIKDSHQPEQLFQQWSEALVKLIGNKNSRPFLFFLESTIPLFRENLVYQSLSTRWKITRPDYQIMMDSVPVIRFPSTDLVCYANNDSVTILNTKGVYYPLNGHWVGQEGRVNWVRAGLDVGTVYADIHYYEIQMKYSRFSADSADLYYRKYFSSPVSGMYKDMTQADISEDCASYPRFESYDKQIFIANIFRDIDYMGGFSVEGAKIIGTGSESENAQMVFRRDGGELIRMKAKVFVIQSNMINSTSTSIAIYYEKDSIFHPGLRMKYLDEKKELTMSKDEQKRVFSPWFDSYHKIDIYCEELTWELGRPKIDFGMMRGPNQEGKAVFESSDYFTLGRYDRLQGIDQQNPLAILRRFSEQKKKREFTLDELCLFMQRPPEQVESQLLNLTTRGFLIYYPDDRKGYLNDKLFDYVDAKNSKTDYDVIFFNSEVFRQSNAILTLDSFDLRLQGVPKVFLSDSQQVYIYPKNQEIILKKNRNFLFSGKVEAGLFDMYVWDCSFDYDKFILDMPTIDSISFFVPARKIDPFTDKHPLVKVKTNITNVVEELYIDDPRNKSGLKPFPQYPMFVSKNDALVT